MHLSTRVSTNLTTNLTTKVSTNPSTNLTGLTSLELRMDPGGPQFHPSCLRFLPNLHVLRLRGDNLDGEHMAALWLHPPLQHAWVEVCGWGWVGWVSRRGAGDAAWVVCVHVCVSCVASPCNWSPLSIDAATQLLFVLCTARMLYHHRSTVKTWSTLYVALTRAAPALHCT